MAGDDYHATTGASVVPDCTMSGSGAGFWRRERLVGRLCLCLASSGWWSLEVPARWLFWSWCGSKEVRARRLRSGVPATTSHSIPTTPRELVAAQAMIRIVPHKRSHPAVAVDTKRSRNRSVRRGVVAHPGRPASRLGGPSRGSLVSGRVTSRARVSGCPTTRRRRSGRG